MVCRPVRVEPEHIIPPAEQTRRMGDITDERRNRLAIKVSGQLQALTKLDTRGIVFLRSQGTLHEFVSCRGRTSRLASG